MPSTSTEKLAAHCHIFLGRPYLPKNKWNDQTIPNAVGLRALDVTGIIDFEALDYIAPAPPSKEQLRPGDVLLAIRGSLAKAALVQDLATPHLYITANLAALRPTSGLLDPSYLWLWLQSKLRQGATEFKRSSTGQQSISLGDLRKMEIPLIPPEEQREISTFVNNLLKFRANQKRIESKAEEFLGSFLQEVFSNE